MYCFLYCAYYQNVGDMWAERRGEALIGWSYITDPWPEFAMVTPPV